MRNSSKAYILLLTVTMAVWFAQASSFLKYLGLCVTVVGILTILVEEICRSLRGEK